MSNLLIVSSAGISNIKPQLLPISTSADSLSGALPPFYSHIFESPPSYYIWKFNSIAMEIALSTTNYWFDRAADMVLVGLPSWGDPILPETWQHSEEEIRASFSWPGEVEDSDKENDYIPMIMSDPLLDKEMTSLLRGPHDSEVSSTYSSGDDTCSMGRDDIPSRRGGEDGSSRCSIGTDSRSGAGSASFDSSLSCSSDGMECEIDDDSQTLPVTDKPPEARFEWSVEALYNHNILSFDLRTASGASMRLQADEILPSIQAILEDAMEETAYFRVQRLDGQSIVIDSSLVIPVVSRLLTSHPHNITPIVESRGAPVSINEQCLRVFSPNPPLKATSPKHRQPADRKRKNRIGTAWKALSGRAKIRTRPPFHVE